MLSLKYLALLLLSTNVPLKLISVSSSKLEYSVNALDNRIINGLTATKGQFPWQAALFKSYFFGFYTAFSCGGSLISSYWVLTAAHCIVGNPTILVSLGVVDLADTHRIQVKAKRLIPHQNYSAQRLDNDIGLIYLSKAVQFSNLVHPIRVTNYRLGRGIPVSVSGWGKTDDGYWSGTSKILKYAALRTINNRRCRNFYGPALTEEKVCAEGVTIESICNGDSGGPLVTGFGPQAELVGVVSFGSSDACAKGHPSGYVRTEYYRKWIRSQTGI